MKNHYLFDSESLSQAIIEKKHRLENDPSARKNIMDYLPGMERIDSDVCGDVMEQVSRFDYARYTERDVREALLS